MPAGKPNGPRGARTEARFPTVSPAAGHYESFYLKAGRPGGGQAVWIRHTVHKRPREPLTGSVWFTLFDADAPGPRAGKTTVAAAEVTIPDGGMIAVADATLTADSATGRLSADGFEAAWELALEPGAEAFHHLPYPFLYRAPVPRTKLLSPHPDARCSGELTVDGERLDVDGWPAMVGHNWGAEHAERWIWIHANELRSGRGFFDAALGRVKVGPLTTPWIGNAVLELDGERHRLGGLDRIRSTSVTERPTECEFGLAGRGIEVRGRVGSEARNFVAWVYADPKGPEHNTVNCSISDLELLVTRKGATPLRLECVGAAAYELGMRERDHGIPLQPYPDG